MLKVLIVDDDVLTRTNLKIMLNWTRYGYEICGEAINGLNAIQMIEDSLPDIVITDMNMPIMDGVALIQFIEQKHPKIKVIALSSYEDFNYVKQSMKNGAVDYILKHKLDSKVLHAALEVAKTSILNIEEELNKKVQMEAQVTSARDMLKHKFIIALISGEIIELEEIYQAIKSLKIELDIKNIIVVAVQIDEYSFIEEKNSFKEQNRIIKAFEDIAQQILNECGKAIISHIDKGKFVILFSFGNAYSNLHMHDQTASSIERIRISIKRYLNLTACFAIGQVVSNIGGISKQYNKAEMMLQEKFYTGKDKILSDTHIKGTKEIFLTLSLSEEKNIIMFTRELEVENVKECIEEIFDKITKSKVSYKSTQMIAAELINIVNRVARELGIDTERVYSSEDIPYKKLQKYDTVLDLKEWIFSVYENLFDLIKGLKIQPLYSENTKRAIEFINANYFKNISLNEAAEAVGVNSSYLSRTFKEDCGKGFVEYLNYIRVEKSKKLIENGEIKLKDIVVRVGFSSYNYFFKVFKDSMGMTPTEYEQSYKK